MASKKSLELFALIFSVSQSFFRVEGQGNEYSHNTSSIPQSPPENRGLTDKPTPKALQRQLQQLAPWQRDVIVRANPQTEADLESLIDLLASSSGSGEVLL